MGDDKDKAAIYLADARKLGVLVLQPDINEFVANFTAIGNDVRFGLRSVRNVGEGVIDSLVASCKSKGKYTSFPDFLDKADIGALNKRAVESLIKVGAFDSLQHSRKGLSAKHEDAIDAVIPVKKQAAIGQDDLFGDLGGDSDEPAFGLDFPIDDSEWPRKQLLAAEREMLGLYVSAHPLDGTEHILSRNRDTTISELLGSGRTEGTVQLSGLITSVDRRMTKQGNPWAIINLADRDGEMEILFFPATYTLVQHALIADTVVSVQGRLNDRDGAVSIFGQEIQVLDVSSAESGGRPPVTLSFSSYKINERTVSELKRILAAHKGESPVRMRVQTPAKTVLYELGFLVDPTSIASDIKGTFGPDAWQGAA
ncbi:OB-fold nucleic acid binding domain-containing protein [Streptomyces sp. NBC_01578]|uniref:helix-hairpin-helix domain-containing protein n=1 Tax=Streptomyces sp. NBC_01578 TaxID=2975884 RepID=UPI00387050E3